MTLMKRNQNQNWLPSMFNDIFDNDWMERSNATVPAINVKETKNAYNLELAAPGMTKDDFQISLDNEGSLVISMEKKNENNEENKEARYLRREFSYTKFQQCMILPDDVDKDKIDAEVKNGVLLISMPKLTKQEIAATQKTIDVK